MDERISSQRLLLTSICLALLSIMPATVSYSHNNPASNQKRREVLQRSCTFGAFLIGAMPLCDDALAAENAGEAIRLGMANVPGYGQPDIYYPQIFEGRWKMTRTITPTNVGENIKVITYEVRFLKKDGNVVQDRGFNEANRLVALDTDKSLLIRETKWDVTNPNVLTITYQDGTGKEFRVTKRACEGDINNSNRWNLSSSEFRRITDVGFNGIPNLSASRVLTKWKPGVDDPKNVIEGLELVMEEGNLGDPMAFSGSVRSNPGSISQPPGGGGAKVKSRLRLDRLL